MMLTVILLIYEDMKVRYCLRVLEVLGIYVVCFPYTHGRKNWTSTYDNFSLRLIGLL